MQGIIDWMWGILLGSFDALPWIIIAIAAALSFKEHRKSKALGMQAIGSGGYLILLVLDWGLTWLLEKMSTPLSVMSAIATIFIFLRFLLISAFALGFCWEKWTYHRAHKAAEAAIAAANAAGITTVPATRIP